MEKSSPKNRKRQQAYERQLAAARLGLNLGSQHISFESRVSMLEEALKTYGKAEVRVVKEQLEFQIAEARRFLALITKAEGK